MLVDTITFPDEMLEELERSRLVVFAGAGVSMGPPANLPDFDGLCIQIAQGTGEKPTPPFDRFLGTLEHRGVLVHKLAAQALTAPPPKHKAIHADLLRLFPTAGQVKLVTTNFDTLFEEAAGFVFEEPCEVFSAPALPLGGDFNGIVHVHGKVSQPSRMILTDRDFGKAYLTEGWGRRFLVSLFMNYTVLFVGYSHNDIVIEYLTRALPTPSKHRQYILLPEIDSQDWNLKGIAPIAYAKTPENDHINLENGIKLLAELCRKRPSDWEEDIKRIATKSPTRDIKDKDTIIRALKEKHTTKFFVDNANSSEWLGWLDDSGLINSLFNSTPLGEKDKLLAYWAGEFAVDHHEELLSVLLNHQLSMNDVVWGAICGALSRSEDREVPIASFYKWIPVLCDHKPRYKDSYAYQFLAEKAKSLKAINLIPVIFNAMITSKIAIKKYPSLYSEEKKNHFYIEYDDKSEHYCIKEVLNKLIMPEINSLFKHTYYIATSHIRNRYEMIKSFAGQDASADMSSWGRSAIEPHEQDKYEKVEDVIIDTARNCLEFACKNSCETAQKWIEILIDEESGLLKRIGIHGMRLLDTISCNKKIDLLLEKNHLLDIGLRHELFMLLKDCYRNADSSQRKKVIDCILSFSIPQDREDWEETTNWSHFTWLAWLHESMPSCPYATEALRILHEKHPDWKLREHPDLTHWHEIGRVRHVSPWTHEELLRMDIAKHIDELLHFVNREFGREDRRGLLIEVNKAAKENLEWGIKLAELLSQSEAWESDLWHELIKAWDQTSKDGDIPQSILQHIHNTNVQSHHARHIAELLYALVKREDRKISIEAINQLNTIASSHYKHAIAMIDETEEVYQDWLQQAINNAAGILAEFWIHSLSVWRKLNEDEIGIPNYYKSEFSKMLQDESSAGGYFRSVICSQLNFLLYADETWTVDNVIPLFTNQKQHQIVMQAWNGYLTWGSPHITAFSYLKDTFFNFEELNFPNEHRDRKRLIEFLTVCIISFVEDKHEEWIQRIFASRNEVDMMTFCYQLQSYIEEANEDHKQDSWEKWIKQYWKRRVDGIPAQLTNSEIANMVTWPVYLPFAFDEAVSIAISMPSAQINDCNLIWKLRKSEFNASHTDSVLKLLTYLSKCDLAGYCWHGMQDIMLQLRESEHNEELEAALIEDLKRLGIQHE